jgi:hypothetical protein
MKALVFFLNSSGLIVDIIGAIGLFFIRLKPLTPIEQTVQFTYAHAFELELLNARIAEVHAANERVHRKSWKWLWVLVIGFGLQLGAAVLGYFTSAN